MAQAKGAEGFQSLPSGHPSQRRTGDAVIEYDKPGMFSLKGALLAYLCGPRQKRLFCPKRDSGLTLIGGTSSFQRPVGSVFRLANNEHQNKVTKNALLVHTSICVVSIRLHLHTRAL